MHDNEEDKGNYFLRYSVKMTLAAVFAIAALSLFAYLLDGGKVFSWIFVFVWVSLFIFYLRYLYLRWFK